MDPLISAPAEIDGGLHTTPKTTESRRRTRQPNASNMNSNGSERRRALEALELLRCRDPNRARYLHHFDEPGVDLRTVQRLQFTAGLDPPAVGLAY